MRSMVEGARAPSSFPAPRRIDPGIRIGSRARCAVQTPPLPDGSILAGTAPIPGLPGIGSSGRASRAGPTCAACQGSSAGGAGARFARGLDRPRPPRTLAAVGNGVTTYRSPESP
jgi:hypothetical protein